MERGLRFSPVVIGLAVLLTACGGGGGGGGGGFPLVGAAPSTTPTSSDPTSTPSPETPSGPSEPTGPSGPTPGTDPDPGSPKRTTPYSYKVGSATYENREAFLAELSSPTMAGSLFFSTTGAVEGGQTVVKAVYEKKGNATKYEHRMALATESRSAAGLKAQGAEGFIPTAIWVDPLKPWMEAIFSKSLDVPTKYEYVEVDDLTGKVDPEAVAPLNVLGQQGYCKLDLTFDGKTVLSRESPTSARCTFELQPARSLVFREFVGQLNDQGQRGYKFAYNTSTFTSTGAKYATIFVRDESQKTTFRYEIEASTLAGLGTQQATEEYLAVLNRHGAAGARWVTDFSEDGKSFRVFMTAYDCSGLLCN